MIDLRELSGEELYRLGREIGEASGERADITHRILFGVRDGMRNMSKPGEYLGEYGFGEILWSLWRYWRGGAEGPRVPFADQRKYPLVE